MHVVVFTYVAFRPLDLVQLVRADIIQELQQSLAPGTISLAIIAISQLLLLGLVPPWLRDRLIHWRRRHPLPGACAFSKIGPADPRVDMAKLASGYGPLPDDPDEQGHLFYRIYSANSDAPGVIDAHKSYLAARDIGMINFLMFVLLPGFAYWATDDFFRIAIYAGCLLFSYVLTAFAAQVYATRLVQNALAAACANHA